MTTDHTREALADLLNQHIKLSYGRCSCGTQLASQYGDYSKGHRQHLADLLAAHVAAVVEGKDAKIERLRRLVDGYEASHTNQRAAIDKRDKEIVRLGGLVEIERDLGDEIDTRLSTEIVEARAAVDVAVAAERERIGAAIEAVGQHRAHYGDYYRHAARIARSTTDGGDTDG